ALKDNSDDAELLALLGLSQLQSGDTTSGIKGLEQAVQVAPENLTLKNELAKAYIATGETDNAISALNAMLAKGGDKKQAQVLLIAADTKAKQYDQAIDVVMDMLQKYVDDPAVLSLAGNVFAISNDRMEARKYFNKALQIEAGYVPATMLLAKLEELEGHADKAELLYKGVAQANSKNIDSLMALARLAGAQNRLDDMISWLQRVGKRSLQDVKSRKVLVEYYLHKKQLIKADLILKELANISPDDSSLLEFKARLQIAEGRYNEALSSLNKLVTKEPASVHARTLLSDIYFVLGQQNDARRQLEIVLKKQPYYAPALIIMANLELQSGNFDAVQDYAARVQKIQPELFKGYELAGDAAMNKKDFASAKINYRQALQLEPLARLAIKLSEVSVHAGKLTEATKPLLVWLESDPNNA
ncbi:MAG: tetratricopeptide repeat protein, partial [Gammaproteobacteria bacterium]|nr:tetratricopeptide repeat protein [Gammaproteobacteria bacterium]